MADVGVMPVPSGVGKVDFYSRTELQTRIIIVYSVTIVFATFFLILRLYTSAAIVRKLDLDIPLILLAWGVSITFFVGMVLSMPCGFGRHLWAVTQSQLLGYYNYLLILALTYIWPPSLTKLAMLVFYERLNNFGLFRVAVYLTAAAVFVYTIVLTGLLTGPCNPLKVGSGVCLNNIIVSQAVLNILSDVVIIVLPIPWIHRLNMPRKQRFIVGSLLGLGSAVVIASIVRIAYVKAMAEDPDVTYTQASAAVWSCLELNLGVACNSLARLQPFVRYHLPKMTAWMGSYSSKPIQESAKAGRQHSMWRGDTGENDVELGALTKSLNDSESKSRAGVYVRHEFQVNVGKAESSKHGSTDNILESGRRGGPFEE